MGSKKKRDLTTKNANNDVTIKADEMLAAIELCEVTLQTWNESIEEQIAKIREDYSKGIANYTKLKTDHEKALKKFALKNKEDLFGKDGDKVALSHGIILYAKEDKVTIPKDAVEQIEKLGWDEGILIVKNIDRPVIEGWNDEKLAAIGASKKPKEIVSWELTANNANSAKNLQAE